MIMDNIKFKQCPKCETWFSREDILESLNIIPLGMTVDEEDSTLSFFYFNHKRPTCDTPFTIPVRRFEPFITEPIPSKINFGNPSCEGHCTSMEDLMVCQQECLYAPFRRFLLKLIDMKNNIKTLKRFIEQ